MDNDSNVSFLKYTCGGLVLLCAIVNFSMFLTIMISAVITLLLVVPALGMNDDDAQQILIVPEYSEEAYWKISTVFMNFVALVHILYKPVSMLLE